MEEKNNMLEKKIKENPAIFLFFQYLKKSDFNNESILEAIENQNTKLLLEKKVIKKEKALLKKYLIPFLLHFALLLMFGISAYMFLSAFKRYRVGDIGNLKGESLNLLEESNDVNLKINIAYKFYSFADISYSSPKETKELPKSFVDWKLINKGGKEDENNYYYIFKNEATKQLIFSFPGTTSYYQLFQEFFGSNLKQFDINDEDILISEYFGSRTLDILEEIFKNEETNNLISKNYSVISTGHSLGGAIAQSFLYFALKKHKIDTKNNKPKSITFSQPRVGNKYFVDFLNKKAKFNLRIKNTKDIVTLIPLCDLGIIGLIKCIFMQGYRHTENELLVEGSVIMPYVFLFTLIHLTIFSLKKTKDILFEFFDNSLVIYLGIALLIIAFIIEFFNCIVIIRTYASVAGIVIVICFFISLFNIIKELYKEGKKTLYICIKGSPLYNYKINLKNEKNEKDQDKSIIDILIEYILTTFQFFSLICEKANHSMEYLSEQNKRIIEDMKGMEEEDPKILTVNLNNKFINSNLNKKKKKGKIVF